MYCEFCYAGHISAAIEYQDPNTGKSCTHIQTKENRQPNQAERTSTSVSLSGEFNIIYTSESEKCSAISKFYEKFYFCHFHYNKTI